MNTNSATKRLRQLLDGRGVKYDTGETVNGGVVATFWSGRDGHQCSAIEGADDIPDDIPDGEVCVQVYLTPEQAIAATLGRGTCELEINTDMTAIRCSKCGYVLPKGTNLMGVRYCAGCGRKVVDE